MTTKRERGRDPEQHVIHPGREVGNAYIGMHGQITGIADVLADDPKAIVELRFHDGITPGGHAVPLIPGAETPRSPLTFASVPPEFPLPAGGTLTINHELGYRPLVQLIAADGEVVADTRLSVVETPRTVAAAPTGATNTNVAGPATNVTNDHTHAAASVAIPNHSHPANVVVTERVYTILPNYSVTHNDVDNVTVINDSGGPVNVVLR